MPYFKSSKKNQPLSTLWAIKSQKCGLRHTVFSVNGNEYSGEWQDNKKHGKGTQVWKSGAIFNGEWKFGQRDGYGTYSVLLPETQEYAKKYIGGWKNGKKHGYGMYLYNNSAVYEGEWSEDYRSGWGRMYYESGDIYEGEWMTDKNHGQGIIQFANGNWYEGTWGDGKKNGNGKFYYPDKGKLYEGFWVDGVAKCGTLSDFGRNEAPTPTKYPIPKLHLVDMQLVLSEAQSAYLERINSKFPLHDTLTDTK
ncbi:MORN repeat-containing protein 3 [Cottoperca gobio]|uniref:MORN repeat-containing protein 3 n=1 Tax=Cottoperca gobio TaxID=56716 RepID=A0A6J2QS47_COTGO|nr:MORN repeat-containing protein 3 [Cottoperca gobio]XP_029300106.1 MORN repeat-containing protein 3 [Cottoperca gobio]XP_029300107.1 MORN repeat-containing protein 3 [Cottoperca gobio]